MKLDKRERKLQKAAREAQARAVVDRLATITEWRARFRPLSRQVMEGLLRPVAAPGSGPIVEIGAGLGELRRWLPEDVLQQVVHTEPLDLAIDQFHRSSPEAQILKAGVEALPFDKGAVGAILALCVLDIVSDGARAAREIARVLRPGGVVIHVLDMTTDLSSAFTLLSASGVIPLPNVFSDPSATRWPEDLFLIPRTELSGIRDILRRNAHPLARPLSGYLALFERQPFAAARAVAEYNQLANHAAHRDLLTLMFRTAYELAEPAERELLAQFRGQPAASSRFLAARLAEWFSPEVGFEVLASDVVTTSGPVAAPPESPFRYFSLCLGEMRQLPTLPPQRLDATALPEDPGEGQAVGELGMFVFVARRLPDSSKSAAL